MELSSQDKLAELAELGKKSLYFFAKVILGYNKFDSSIHLPLCLLLQDYKKNTRICATMPRGWYKSTTCSVAYPLWRAINNPNVRILIALNTFSNATKKLGEIKQIVEKNSLFRACYPSILPNASCKWTDECLTFQRTLAAPEGTIEAAGVGTSVTSRHYDLVIEDDTVSPENSDMSVELTQPTTMDIEKAIGWHRMVHPLLLDPLESQIIVVGTRWAERDLLSWIKSNSPDYKFHLKAITEIKTESGFESASIEEGGSLTWPARFNLQVYNQLVRDYGPSMFSCLMLNKPVSSLNAVFKRDMVQYYETLPQQFLYYCTSVDTDAMGKNAEKRDYSVVLTSATNPVTGLIYVVHYDRAQMTPGELIATIMRHYEVYSPMVVKVEGIAYQRTLIYWLERHMRQVNKFFAVEEVKSASASKLDRITGLQPYFNNKQVLMRSTMVELEREMLMFPRAEHDDVIDALSMQRDFWNNVFDGEKEKQSEMAKNDLFSFENVVSSLFDRNNKPNKYPYDIGYLSMRLGSQPYYKKAIA